MLQQSWQAGQRNTLTERLKSGNETWDVVIVGGGITGAGVAREAARRGLKTLLLERQDFAWGTSSRSSKMVHGGLRYIASGDIKTTMHSVKERERLMKEAPGLVDQMSYMMTHYQGNFPGPLAFNALLRVYDQFAGKRYRQFHPKKDAQYFVPSAREDKMIGGTQFADAVTDDSRLVLRVMREAQQDGAEIINYVGVASLIKEGDKTVGVIAKDAITGDEYQVRADAVLNATGAWADDLRGELGHEKKIRPCRGSHIIVPKWRLPVAQALTVIHPDDSRPIFIFPWEGRTVIGTTDLDHPELGNKEAAITREEVDYLIKVVHDQFPKCELKEEDVISTFAGVRPLVSSGALDPSKEKRDHTVWTDNGLVTVSGGKLTTFRLIALDVLKAAEPFIAKLDMSKKAGKKIFPKVDITSQAFKKLPSYVQKHLSGRYGRDADALVECAQEGELEIIPGSQNIWAEVRWTARTEAIAHLDDLLLRRTRLGLLLPNGGLDFAEKIKSICAQELSWDDATWQQEVERYQGIIDQYYSLPA